MKNNQSTRTSFAAALLTSVLALGATSAFAADSGNITIQGTVSPVNELTVTPQAGYNALDLTSGATEQTVAVVNEKNNDPDGYTVTLVSANAQAASSSQARLKGADTDNATVVNYSIKYGVAAAEAAVTLDGSGSAVVSSTSAASIEAGADKNMKITFLGATWKNADTYSDTLTLTIAAK